MLRGRERNRRRLHPERNALLLDKRNTWKQIMDTVSTLRTRIASEPFNTGLASVYGCRPDETDLYALRCRAVLDDFAAAFGKNREAAFFSAPGRTEIGGNHTDHQNGCVLAASVNRDILAAAGPNRDNVVRIFSDAGPVETVSLEDLSPNPEDFSTSRALIRGMAARFRAEGHTVGGFDVRAVSTVLRGSGLSSSAAFEVLIGNIFNGLYCGSRVGPVAIAKFGQYAENVFFGKPSGLMDQLASSVGGVLRIDFRNHDNPDVKKIHFDPAAFDHALCIIDSGGSHANMSGAYGEIPAEMNRVAELLGHDHLAFADRNAFLVDLPRLRAEAGDRAVLRAWHFFNETERARQEARALEEDRFGDFLALVRESGRSSALYLQNVHLAGAVREQAVDVALALCEGILGTRGACRVHGGGFAGTIQAFVPNDMLDAFSLEVEAVLGKGSCHVLGIRPEGGVMLVFE